MNQILLVSGKSILEVYHILTFYHLLKLPEFGHWLPTQDFVSSLASEHICTQEALKWKAPKELAIHTHRPNPSEDLPSAMHWSIEVGETQQNSSFFFKWRIRVT